MTTDITRRAVIGSGLTAACLLALNRYAPRDNNRRNFPFGRNASRDPLSIAMLDTHAARLAPILADLEVTVERRFQIDALSAHDLYSAYTIDLLQQTGRYDVVSMVDAWIPYFGRRGYLTDVPDLTNAGPDTYPPLVLDAAQGIDGTQLVAWPWTIDVTCNLWNGGTIAIDPATWSDFFLANPDESGIPTQLPLASNDSAAQCFRSTMLSFGKDLVDPVTHQPTMESYEAIRALETIKRLAKRGPADASLQVDSAGVVSNLQSGATAVGMFLDASGTWPLWPGAGWRSSLTPEGRPGDRLADVSVWMLGIPAGAPHLDSARQLVTELVSIPWQTRLWPASGLVPATADVLQREWAANAPALELTVAHGLGMGTLWPRLRSFRDIISIAGETVRNAVQGNGETEALLANAQTRMLAELQQENELIA
jgi:ABC-type glycerol-3-phosphate transport system substrate-binding protein